MLNVDYDEGKVDNAVLALLSLTVHQEDQYGSRAWLSHDWDVLDRLSEKGPISNPASKARSVILTSEGLAKSRELFKSMFANDAE